ncbi:MAG: hypothetical protein Ct9H300mP1_08510 [Planctomycetaceae bacterium]|nr:MAG: hypothetical protein Ct9H300mP1_08510 [Planctomycetaceae bacterium]
MSYFTRLTDIVTCNLSELLDGESDPQAAIVKLLLRSNAGWPVPIGA